MLNRKSTTILGYPANRTKRDQWFASLAPGYQVDAEKLPNRATRTASTFLNYLVLSLCMSCSATLISVQAPGADARIPTAAIVIGQFDLHLESTSSWQHFDRLRDVIRAIEDSPYDAIAPGEFNAVFPPTKPNDWFLHTNVGPVAERLGIPKAELIVLTITIESAYSEQQVDLLQGRNEESANKSQGRLQADIRVVHPMGGRVLLDYSATQAEDRYDEIDETDSRPELSRFVRQLMKDLLLKLQRHQITVPIPPRRSAAAPQVRENSLLALDHRYGSRSLRSHLSTLDPVLAQAFLYGRVRAQQASITPTLLTADEASPLGLQVLNHTGSLRPGQRIICVDGQRVVGTWQWKRAYRRSTFRQVTRANEGRFEAVSPVSESQASPPPERCMTAPPAMPQER